MSETANAIDPVRFLPTDRDSEPGDGTAVCLSGGGYRAMLFHVGCLWRLYEVHWLDGVDRFSAVSGGSITAGVLAREWTDLVQEESDRHEMFRARVVEPIRRLAARTVDGPAIIKGVLLPTSTVGQQLAANYRTALFGEAGLSSLPEHPVFVFNATNVATGNLVRFSKHSIADWRVGRVMNPDLSLATAIACSSACPPFLSPYRLRLRNASWTTEPGNDLTSPQYRRSLTLTDGGVYDNLGLETAWKRCRTLFVSDGGGIVDPEPHPAHDWVRHTLRIMALSDHQVRALRKRQAIGSLVERRRAGTYVGIRSDIANYGLLDSLPAPVEQTLRLANTPTRLKRMPAGLQDQLINWGYAIADAGLRQHINANLPPPAGFPYPSAGVGR